MAIVLIFSLAIRIRIAVLPVEYLANMHLMQYKAGTVLLEDSFYTLNIARNFALGKGLTHDGIHQTTGVQPLTMFLAASIYRFFPKDKHLPVHIYLCILAVVSVLSMLLAYGICRKAAGPYSGIAFLFFWAAAPGAIMQLNGLETTLSVFFNLLLLFFYQRYFFSEDNINPTVLQWFLMGIIAGLAVFARIDAMLWILALLITLMIKKPKLLAHEIPKMLIGIAGAVLAYLPWLIISVYHTGRLYYDSGNARKLIAKLLANEPSSGIPDFRFFLENLKEMFRAMIEMHPLISPWLTAPRITIAGVVAASFFIIAVCIGGRKQIKFPLTLLIFTAWYSFIFVVIYVFFQYGRDFYHRYLASVIILTMMVCSIFITFFFSIIFQKQRKAVRIALIAAFISVIPYVYYPMYDYLALWESRVDYYQNRMYRFSGMAKWINQNIPHDALVGSFQTGQLSYFSNRTIINLDGIVNYDAYQAMKTGQMADYVRTLNLKYLADWDVMIEKLLQNASVNPLKSSEMELIHRGYFTVYRLHTMNE
ncbi:glycosyltransferase family 39 protein [bacterium]|nr:glycosyltransferase family 39 protein [candidate division CSSED10-310 bacterium]